MPITNKVLGGSSTSDGAQELQAGERRKPDISDLLPDPDDPTHSVDVALSLPQCCPVGPTRSRSEISAKGDASRVSSSGRSTPPIQLDKEFDLICSICGEPFFNPCTLPCGHHFDRGCLRKWSEVKGSCPVCRGELPEELPPLNAAMLKQSRKHYAEDVEERIEEAKVAEEIFLEEEKSFFMARTVDHMNLIRSIRRQGPGEDAAAVTLAMSLFPRGDFVPPSLRADTYNGSPTRLPAMHFNVSAPSVHMSTLEGLDIKSGCSVLDVGCGSGYLTAVSAVLAGPSGTVVGIDISDKILAYTRRSLEIQKRLMGQQSGNANKDYLFHGCVASNMEDLCFFMRITKSSAAGPEATSFAFVGMMTWPHRMQVTTKVIGSATVSPDKGGVRLNFREVSRMGTGRMLGSLALPCDYEVVVPSLEVGSSGTGWREVLHAGATGEAADHSGITMTMIPTPTDKYDYALECLNRIELRKANLFDMPPSRKFDRIIVSAECPPQYVHEIFELLAPNGICMIPIRSCLVRVKREGNSDQFIQDERMSVMFGKLEVPADARGRRQWAEKRKQLEEKARRRAEAQLRASLRVYDEVHEIEGDVSDEEEEEAGMGSSRPVACQRWDEEYVMIDGDEEIGDEATDSTLGIVTGVVERMCNRVEQNCHRPSTMAECSSEKDCDTVGIDGKDWLAERAATSSVCRNMRRGFGGASDLSRKTEESAPCGGRRCKGCGNAVVRESAVPIDMIARQGEDLKLNDGRTISFRHDGVDVHVTTDVYPCSSIDSPAVASVQCKECKLYLGVKVMADSDVRAPDETLVGTYLLVKSYLCSAEADRDVVNPEAAPSQPSEAAGSADGPFNNVFSALVGERVSGSEMTNRNAGTRRKILCRGTGCSNVISDTSQILSMQHRWDLGDGSERAGFYNSLRVGSVTEEEAETHSLAQGDMQCAVIRCSVCQAKVGWKFVSRTIPSDCHLASYEGRFGLVNSRMVCEDGSSITMDSGGDDDEYLDLGAMFRAHLVRSGLLAFLGLPSDE